MRHVFRFLIAAAVAVLLLQPSGGAQADPIKQIPLTEKQVEGYIAAQKDMAPLIEKVQTGDPDKPDPKVVAELESAAKKNGFASYADYDDVATNIALVFGGLDPKSKAFTEPTDALKQQIDELRADKSISAAEKKEMLDELNEELKDAKPIEHRGNIELVKKYYYKLVAAMQ